jgi:hypothetical protein
MIMNIFNRKREALKAALTGNKAEFNRLKQEPRYVVQITDSTGKVIAEHTQDPDQDPGRQMLDLLAQIPAGGSYRYEFK